jgi:hypothetical protein
VSEMTYMKKGGFGERHQAQLTGPLLSIDSIAIAFRPYDHEFKGMLLSCVRICCMPLLPSMLFILDFASSGLVDCSIIAFLLSYRRARMYNYALATDKIRCTHMKKDG